MYEQKLRKCFICVITILLILFFSGESLKQRYVIKKRSFIIRRPL